jgi:hypothetical protein
MLVAMLAPEKPLVERHLRPGLDAIPAPALMTVLLPPSSWQWAGWCAWQAGLPVPGSPAVCLR